MTVAIKPNDMYTSFHAEVCVSFPAANIPCHEAAKIITLINEVQGLALTIEDELNKDGPLTFEK